MRLSSRWIFRGALVAIAGSSLSIVASAQVSSWQSRVSPELVAIYVKPDLSGATPSLVSRSKARFDSKGRVQLDVHYDCATNAPSKELKAAGLLVGAVVRASPLCVVEGWAAPSALPALAAIEGVKLVKLPVYAQRRRPSPVSAPPKTEQLVTPQGVARPQATLLTPIDGNAITIMHADQYISSTSVTGSGTMVGVMSDNVTSLSVIQGRGELPAVFVVPGAAVGNLNPIAGDEGTMMLEEVHALAPGAELAFCGPETSVEYVACLGQLVNTAGASILVDDQAFSDEDLMSANGTFAQGVATFLSQNPNVLLVTVTENYNGSYWEGAYNPVSVASLGLGGSTLTCSANGQVDSYINNFNGAVGEVLTVGVTKNYPLTMQWADPFGANVSNFDVYWVNTATNASVCLGAAGSTDTFFASSSVPLSTGTYDIFIGTPDTSLSGKFMKFWVGGDGDTSLSTSTPGSVVSPQAFVPGVLTTGATNAADGIGDTIESYSGQGPVHLIFPSPMAIQAPSFVSLDAVYVDDVGTTFSSGWADGLFHGTSAAAPNAAAVAALIRAAFPSLTPAELTSALQAGATPLGNSIPNGTFGYGRVDAIGALGTIPFPTMTGWPNQTVTPGTTSPPQAFTVGGVGNLTLSVKSSNSNLIPAVLVPSGTPGVTVAPATCGAPTTACTIALTPSLSGQTGAVQVTLIATDGAGRTASIVSNNTVNQPPQPTVTVTAGGSQSLAQGVAAAPVAFTLTGTGALNVSASSGNTAVVAAPVTISNGCGSTTLSCTAVLNVPASASGNATVTFTVVDAWRGQGQAVATVTVAAPPGKGGGGALDLVLLGALSGVLLLRSRRKFGCTFDPRH